MAEVTGFTSARMKIIEDETVVDGEVQGDNLILITRAGTPIDAGNVRGPVGPVGPPITDGNKGDITVSATGTNWQINPDAVTNAELADMPAGTLKGASVAGNPVDLTLAQVEAALPGVKSVNALKGDVIAPRVFTNQNTIGAWDAPIGALAQQTKGYDDVGQQLKRWIKWGGGGAGWGVDIGQTYCYTNGFNVPGQYEAGTWDPNTIAAYTTVVTTNGNGDATVAFPIPSKAPFPGIEITIGMIANFTICVWDFGANGAGPDWCHISALFADSGARIANTAIRLNVQVLGAYQG